MSKEDKLSRLKEAFTKVNEDLIRFRGSDPVQGKIFSIIILSPNPITQEDIANKTGYSRSQISRLLKGLENSALITARTQPGSRTQLYEGRAKSFLDNFRQLFVLSGRLLGEKSNIIDQILEESRKMPDEIKMTDEAKKLTEVATVYSSIFHAFLEILDEFVKKFEDKIKNLEKDLLKKKF